MFSTLSRSLVFTLLSATAACTASDPDGPGGSGGAGGKADGATTTTQLVELSEADQQYLRAADAECLHVNVLDEPYFASIKMFCMANGGVAAPYRAYIAAVALGESGSLYKVYEVPSWSSELPTNVFFRASADGSTATLGWDISLPVDADGLSSDYYTKTVTATLAFSGDQEDPTIAAKVTQ